MKSNFAQFIEKFPVIELPLTLRDDSSHDFKDNPPLSDTLIDAYISRYETAEIDEFTEYMACFQLPKKPHFQAIVYWKAALLTYDFILATYNKEGNMLDKKVISGVKVVENDVKLSIAVINIDFSINIAEGLETRGGDFNADATKARRFQILENGLIEQEY